MQSNTFADKTRNRFNISKENTFFAKVIVSCRNKDIVIKGWKRLNVLKRGRDV